MHKANFQSLLAMLLLPWALASCGQGSSTPASASAPIFQNGQAASVVIGQPNFTTKTLGGGAGGMNFPIGRPAVVLDRYLYIADMSNNRVLGYSPIPTANGTSASFVLGQTNFINTFAGSTAITLYNPASVGYDPLNWQVYVADSSSNRVLEWSGIPVVNDAPASFALGQTALSGNTAGCVSGATTATSMMVPIDVFVTGNQVLVADNNSNRILIWNTIPFGSGVPANLVLGQSSMLTCYSNRNGIVTPGTLSGPQSVWSDGTRIIVADSFNHRVLIWNSFPTANGAPADVVLGQPDMFSSTATLTGGASGLNFPFGVDSDGTRLAVADVANQRVLIWNSIPTVNNAPADIVLGQPDFTSVAAPTSATAANLWGPRGVLWYGDQLFVVDTLNNRVLIFQGQ